MADLLLRNARIWTGVAETPWADAALVRDGRFAFVGREGDLAAPAGVDALDARGRLVLPGLIDGHAHLLSTGMALRSVDLKGVASEEEAVRRVGERAAPTAGGAWIEGAGWDQHVWQHGRFPDRRSLDAVAPEQPVALAHTSGHCLWVNSAALRAAGVDASTATPEGGAIDRDRDGAPSGILRDTAMRLVYDAMPSPSAGGRASALREAMDRALSLGLTGAHAMDAGRGEWQALRALRDDGVLRLRVRAYLTERRLDEWTDAGLRTGDGDALLRLGGVKCFMDGALGSLTAWLLEPYEGTDDMGLALIAPEELERRVRAALGAGLAPAVHAIGDRANREALSILERTRDVSPALPRRIEHAQLLAPGDIAAFARLGVVASVQPVHATQDMRKVDRWWGARGRQAYAFASLRARGATLAFGSDSPVETIDPIAGLHAAVTRRDAKGEPPDGWHPGERVPLETAVGAYTAGCAAAAGERDAGRIAPGHHGDFVVLSRDLFAVRDEMELLDTRVDVTVVGGAVVYEREEARR